MFTYPRAASTPAQNEQRTNEANPNQNRIPNSTPRTPRLRVRPPRRSTFPSRSSRTSVPILAPFPSFHTPPPHLSASRNKLEPRGTFEQKRFRRRGNEMKRRGTFLQIRFAVTRCRKSGRCTRMPRSEARRKPLGGCDLTHFRAPACESSRPCISFLVGAAYRSPCAPTRWPKPFANP